MLLAVEGFSKPFSEMREKGENPDIPDIATLKFILFEARGDQPEVEIDPDSYQPLSFMSKAGKLHLDDNIRLKGEFAVSIDFGRLKIRELVLSRDRIFMTREKADLTMVNVDLCLRRDVILVAYHPRGATKFPSTIGSISFFWKKGSGKTSVITAANMYFADAEEMKVWAAFLTYQSKCNEVAFPNPRV